MRSKSKAELRVRNSQHDRLQMESILTFDLKPFNESEEQRRYEVDVYLYIPRSIGINSSSYPPASFLRHFTSYYRIRTPKLSQWAGCRPEDFRMPALEDYLNVHMETFERRRLAPRVVQEIKLFGNLIHTELKGLQKRCRRKGPKPEHLAALERIHGVIWTFRDVYATQLRQQPLLLGDDIRRVLRLTDEYISYRTEVIDIRIMKVAPEWKERIEGWLKRETEYRESTGILSLHQAEDSDKTFEAYTYRLGLLKKYLAEVLYLSTESAKQDHIYRNGVAAIGAGLAATFAGWAEHNRIQYLTGNDSGIRLTVLIGIAVVAYVFKDRIKDLSKEYFNNRLKTLLPDRRWALSYPFVHRDGSRGAIDLGFAQEYVRYLKNAPEEIQYLRTIEKKRDLDPKRRDEILHLARRFDFCLRSQDQKDDIRYLKNVVRIDFANFLAKLDNPSKTVHYYSGSQGNRVTSAPKVYHVNVLCRYRTVFGGEQNPIQVRTDYERLRVVLNKNGIVRIETVIQGGELAHLDEVRR